MKFDIDYIAHNNRLTNSDVYVKVIFSIVLMILTLIFNNILLDVTVFILMAFLVLGIAKISLKAYIKFLTIPLIFLVITSLFLIFFFSSGEIILDTGLLGIGVSQSSLDLGINTFCRCFACFACLGFLTLTTPIADLVQCLYKIKIPVVFIEIALLMYNTIFIFLDQLSTMKNAQETRLGYMGTKNTYNSLAILFTNLFFKSLDKSETLQCSLDSRCYQGYLPVYKPKRGYKNVKSE